MWKIVEEGPPGALSGDLVSEPILHWDASGHVGIVVVHAKQYPLIQPRRLRKP